MLWFFSVVLLVCPRSSSVSIRYGVVVSLLNQERLVVFTLYCESIHINMSKENCLLNCCFSSVEMIFFVATLCKKIWPHFALIHVLMVPVILRGRLILTWFFKFVTFKPTHTSKQGYVLGVCVCMWYVVCV